MSFGSYDTPKSPTKPTFFQYLKSAHKNIEGKTKFGVEIIWLPSKFQNVTLQTHAFRYICNEDHPLYNESIEYCSTLDGSNMRQRLDITIDSIENKKITVSESTRKSGQWEKLGQTAWKFKE